MKYKNYAELEGIVERIKEGVTQKGKATYNIFLKWTVTDTINGNEIEKKYYQWLSFWGKMQAEAKKYKVGDEVRVTGELTSEMQEVTLWDAVKKQPVVAKLYPHKIKVRTIEPLVKPQEGLIQDTSRFDDLPF